MNAEIGQGHELGVGALLRASRLRCGEELRDIAALLRIRYPFLEAIEEGRYGELPGSAYAVGFVRTYAEHLGLDSNEVVRRFKAEAENLERKTDLSFPIPIAERSTPGGAIVFVGILLAAVAYGAWYVGTSKNSFLVDLVSPLPNRLSALVHGDGAPAAAPDTAAARPLTAEAGSSGQAPSATVAETTPAATAPQGTPAPSEPAGTATSSEPVAPADKPAATGPQPAIPAAMPAPAPAPAKPIANPKPAGAPAAPVSGTATPAAASAPVAAPVVPAVRSEPAAAKPPVTPPAAPKPAPVDTAAATPEAPRPSGPAPSTPSVADVPASPVAGPVAESPAAKPAATTTTPPAAPDAVAPKPAQPATIEPATAGTAASSPKAVQPPAQVAAIPAAPEVTPPTGPQGQPEGAAAKASRIVVRAKLDSWIQVRDGVARRLLVTRLLRAGDTYRVPDQPDLTLLTGNAGALEITVDGTVVPSIGGVGAVRRDVVLDAEKLKAGTAVVN